MKFIIGAFFILGLYFGGALGSCLVVVAIGLIMLRLGVDEVFCLMFTLVLIGMIVANMIYPFPKGSMNLFGTGGIVMLVSSVVLTIAAKRYYRSKCKNITPQKAPAGKYVYVETDPGTWTTGFFAPDGRWTPESDHASPEEAAQRINFLNGQEQQGILRKA